MSVEVPAEPVYYYECSNGNFRLNYFIPFERLEELVAEGALKKEVLEDYPDGIDLNCTKHDFDEFEAHYGYRPKYKAETLQSAFYAIWTDTHDWEQTTHADFISADVIENSIPQEEMSELPEITAPTEDIETAQIIGPDLKERRSRQTRRNLKQRQILSKLQNLRVRNVNPEAPIYAQKFVPPKMQEGEKAQNVFIRLSQNLRGK